MLSASPHGLIAVLLFAAAITVTAAPPDLTNGGVPGDTISFNMGPTGARGWVYHVRENSSESRQIQIKSVASGSPAAGILAADDVILGASGTGAEPVNFTSDARKSLGLAIGDAEAQNPATLKLIRWRSSATSTVEITLQHMGAYSATAPYNCPKSTLILQQGLQAIMAGETAGRYSFGTLGLLAGNNPADPNNAARMARAQTEARALIPSAAVMQQMMSDERDTGSPWQRGHTLVVLAEYYLLTGDALVIPAIEAHAVNIARNSSLFGTMGHIFATKNPDGSDNGPMGGVYGPVNSSGMPCFLGLLLAKECGITHPTLELAITRMSRFYAYYAGRGAVPYGEHEAYWQRHESNGKSGLAAICFHLLGNRAEEGKFNAKMAVAATTEREMGHTGAFFNYLWSPLGAAAGGEQAAAAHFSGIRWMLDLNRRWDGKFDYDCLSGEGPNSGATYSDFRMSTAALLTYALPLRQLRVTGKNHDSARWLASTDVSQATAVDGYDPVSRTTNQLIADLGSWSPMVQRRAAEQLATRSIDTSMLNQITALANDPNGGSRIGACFTLGKISNSTTANARAATLAALLTDPENHVRFMAAEAMRYMPDTARLSQLNVILTAAASTGTPLMPFDEEDPLHFAHGRLAMLLFYSGNAYGPKGVIWGSKINTPTVINRSLLYPAIRAIAANPVGQARSCLTETYRNLTADDVNAIASAVVESVRIGAPSDKMFNGGVRMGGLDALEKFKKAEGVPLSMIYMVDDTRSDAYTYGLNVLKKYDGGSKTVTPDPEVVQFCQSLLGTAHAAAAQEVINLIAASSNPPPLTPFKSIQSATADAPLLNLPSTQTTLRANAIDLAEGDLVFTWRKIHGAGNVTFTPNGTSAAKNTAIQYDGVPGNYLFEVTVTDSRGLTEVYGTVACTLRNPDGTLPLNSPPTAHPQAVNAIPGDAKSITLTGTDPEGYPLVFSVASQPAHGTLTGTAPNLIYTADIFHTGADGFTFEAMDSEGQTASATVSINVSTANAELLVHEPFDYAAGGLNGKGNTSEIGLAGTWNASTSAQVVANSLSHGSLPVSGGSIGNLNGGSNNYGGTRALSASALAGKGLLDDGATLWFSVIMGYGTNYAVDPPVSANMTNARLAFALANSGFSTGNNQYYILNEGSQLGEGIGVTLGRFSTNGKIVATQFRDSTAGTSGSSGNVFGNVPVSTVGANSHRLVVGKITWGAESDTIELYEPDANMNLNLPTSTLTVNVDQSKFDVITWARGDTVTMDEIRFGDSLAAVVGLDLTPPDTTPPTLSGIADDRGGETSQQGEVIAYTLTFSEPMDPATIGMDDFGNAGTSAFTIQSITQPLPHVVLVQVKPTTTGTLQFRIQQGAVLNDLVGNSLDTASAIPDDTIITVNTPMVDVPFVLGMTQAEADAIITGTGLVTGTVITQYSATIPADLVISQSPSGGSTVDYGSSVDLVVSLGPVPDKIHAAADIAVSGTVTNTHTATHASDNVRQSIIETESGGNPNNRYSFLEHKWRYEVPVADTLIFTVEAHHSANTENDDFAFAYSTAGANGPWQDMLTVTKTADDHNVQTFALPPGTSGTIHVRVIDTDRTTTRRVLDTVYIDHMYFQSESTIPMTTVPNVTGLAQSTAESNIAAANLVVGAVTTENHATVPAGDVISQNPVGGASVAEGSAVDLVVSLGPAMTTVPNVTGLAQATAESNITAANLVVGTVTTQNHATIPAGSVISQSPNGGASVSGGSAVNLVVSLGPLNKSDHAIADIPVFGMVLGTYVSTHASDNIHQALTEVESTEGVQKNHYSYLEHKWEFNVKGGDVVSFHVEAHHTVNNESDDFIFAYSANGVNGAWQNMFMVTKTSDNNTAQTFVLPPGTSGTVHVRVLDTNRGRGRRSLDTLFIDAMHILSQTGGSTTIVLPDDVAWASAFKGANVSNPDADWDGDGLSNRDERIWGLDPTNATSCRPIQNPLDPKTGTFRYTRRDRALTGLTYSVWTSSDLVNWTEDLSSGQLPGDPDEYGVLSEDVTLSPELLVHPSLFIQLRARE